MLRKNKVLKPQFGNECYCQYWAVQEGDNKLVDGTMLLANMSGAVGLCTVR